VAAPNNPTQFHGMEPRRPYGFERELVSPQGDLYGSYMIEIAFINRIEIRDQARLIRARFGDIAPIWAVSRRFCEKAFAATTGLGAGRHRVRGPVGRGVR
jgi:hypothetical protein